MKIIVEPTEEKFDAPINGVTVPTRIWHGVTDKGTEVEAYILSIVPVHDADCDKLFEESRAGGLVRTASIMTVDVDQT